MDLTSYAKKRRCPVCNAREITRLGSRCVDDEAMALLVRCRICNSEWDEYYYLCDINIIRRSV